MQVALSALAHTCTAALEQWSAGDARDIARVAKAVAGRSGVAIAQHALQCFGAIGFTEEHVHPLYQKRILVLDMLLGSSFELRRELAKALVETGRAPRCVQIWRP
jgi:alkylation response protein AidB-like acyl-CoA dehydrogenase